MKVATLMAYEQMDDWQKMECRLGKYLTGKIINGKIYYKVDYDEKRVE